MKIKLCGSKCNVEFELTTDEMIESIRGQKEILTMFKNEI